jgi:hypothetical protein
MAEVLKLVFYVGLFFYFGWGIVHGEGLCDISEFLYSNFLNSSAVVWFDIDVAVRWRRAVRQLWASLSEELYSFIFSC